MSEKKPSKPLAVVFDLDDTLYPERQYAFSGFREVAEFIDSLYSRKIYPDLVRHYMAGEREDLFKHSLQNHFKGVEDSFINKVLYIYWAHIPRIALYADADICLADLQEQSIRVGIVTTGSSSIQRNKVQALNLEPLVDAVVYNDELLGRKAPGQPSEDAFHIIALQLGVDPRDTLYVGDNPLTDFLIPKKLGLRTVWIQRPDSEHHATQPPTREHVPDLTIPVLTQLTTLWMARAGLR